MISCDQAVAIIRKAGGQKLLQHETVKLEDIPGRICALDIRTSVANQPYDNSAMDGFALHSEDLTKATDDNPVVLDMVGHIAAGDPSRFTTPAHGQCYEIMTGAPVPPGCDTVVPVEKTENGHGSGILFSAPSQSGQNIRRTGEDYVAGDTVIEKGKILDVGHILVLATLGIGQVAVLKRPRVALISTGLEVVDELDEILAAGQIYNSTRPYLASALRTYGADVTCYDTVPDDPQMFKDRLSAMMEDGVDMAISTGAVSAGVHDFIPSVLREMGADILFHKVAIKPGKPVLFARLPGAGPFFIGLPGNPVSSAAGLRFFGQPLIRSMQALPPEEPQFALLKNSFNGKKGHRRLLLRGKLHHTDKAVNDITIPENQQSFRVRPFVDTNVWAAIPEGTEFLKAGARVRIYR